MSALCGIYFNWNFFQCTFWLASVVIFTHAMPIPDSQVDIEIDDYEDLLAVENQIEENFVAIAPPPKGFPGEFIYDFLS